MEMHKQILLYFLVKTAKTCCSSQNSASKSISMKVLDYPEYHASVLCHTISMLRADKGNVTGNNGIAICKFCAVTLRN